MPSSGPIIRSVRLRTSLVVCGAAQDEDRQHRQLALRQPPPLVGDVAVADRAPAVRRVHEPHQAHRLERQQRGLHGAVVPRHDRVAVRRLVARQAQGVERQRVAVGDRRLLLDEAGDDPGFFLAQHHACSLVARLPVAADLVSPSTTRAGRWV